MIIQIASDIHIEKIFPKIPSITDYITPVEGVDILVLAGDIGSVYQKDALTQFLNSCKQVFKNIIYVPGNNEYYERDGFEPKLFDELIDDLKTICVECGVIFMDNDYIEGDDFIIFGSTWWSYIPDSLGMRIYKEKGVQINADDFNLMHNTARRCLSKIIENKGNKDLIVITHYCPTKFGTMNMHHKKSDFTELIPYYFSSSEKFIKSSSIDVWIFGHTHVFGDFIFEGTKTRIISNADPRKRFFRKNFTIEIETENIENVETIKEQ